MSEEVWDAVVVGAGVVGSWTAYHLRNQGLSTLLLDQFPLPHTRGSSNGPTRLIRTFYDKDEYIVLMPECYEWWKKLESLANTKLFEQTGMIEVQDRPHSHLKTCSAVMERHNMPHVWLDTGDLDSKYPMFRYGQDFKAVLDPLAGELYSNKCVQVVQDQFKQSGGKIQDGVQVTSIEENGHIIVLRTRKGAIRAKKVTLCPGPWAKDLLQSTGLDIPLVTMPGRQAYFKVKDNRYDINNGVPIVIHEMVLPDGYQFVIVKPENEYPGFVKVATRGQPLIGEAHPNERDKNVEKNVYDCLKQYVIQHLPYVDPEPCITENCVYTMTPDQDYVIDQHPTMRNVTIGCGFSGHGFKTAPVVGKLLSQLLLQQPLSYDITKWKISRFQKSKL